MCEGLGGISVGVACQGCVCVLRLGDARGGDVVWVMHVTGSKK